MVFETTVDPIEHVESKENIADICTHKGGHLADIGHGSLAERPALAATTLP